jgi:superfamily I DNA/RNA helicase
MTVPNVSDEQLEYIVSPARRKILQAPAGSGKTYTIVEQVKLLQKEKKSVSLFTFDQANSIEAKRRIRTGATIQTFHSLAYLTFGKPHAQRLVPNLSPYQLVELIPWSKYGIGPNLRLQVAAMAIKVLSAYCTSADRNPAVKHTSSIFERNGIIEIEKLLTIVGWLFMEMNQNQLFPMTHDTYLKAYQLMSPFLDVDSIIVDEGQDTNPVCLSIALNQLKYKRSRPTDISLVGDKDQSIYLFRNAINALVAIENASKYTLTASHRFGKRIAFLAQNTINLAKEEPVRIIGLGAEDKITLYNSDSTQNKMDLAILRLREFAMAGKTVMILCRSLRGIAEAALAVMRINRDRNKHITGEDVGFRLAGGIQKYGLNRFVDAHDLYEGRPTLDPLLKSFKSFSTFEEYSDTVNAQDWISVINFVKRYRAGTTKIIRAIQFQNLESAQRRKSLSTTTNLPPHIVISSAHRSKGLEADAVLVWDDFTDWDDLIGDTAAAKMNHETLKLSELEQEVNLIYVAITRAKENLIIPSKWNALTKGMRF